MVTDGRVRVLVCDDHPMVREGVTRLLGGEDGIEVVRAAASGEEGVELAHALGPDVVLMDLAMPGIDGVEATRRISSALAGTRVVILTSFGDDGRVRDAIGAGAVGFVLKDTDGRDLVRAVLAAARGEVPLDPRAAGALLTRSRRPADLAGMTARERRCSSSSAPGWPTRRSPCGWASARPPVKAHLTRIFRRVGARRPHAGRAAGRASACRRTARRASHGCAPVYDQCLR